MRATPGPCSCGQSGGRPSGRALRALHRGSRPALPSPGRVRVQCLSRRHDAVGVDARDTALHSLRGARGHERRPAAAAPHPRLPAHCPQVLPPAGESCRMRVHAYAHVNVHVHVRVSVSLPRATCPHAVYTWRLRPRQHTYTSPRRRMRRTTSGVCRKWRLSSRAGERGAGSGACGWGMEEEEEEEEEGHGWMVSERRR